MRAESSQTCCCGQPLLTQKTRKRIIVTQGIGKIHIHETVKHCGVCKKVYAAEELDQWVPQYCNFGFDVMVYAGKALFQDHRTESETVADLAKQNVIISEREVSYLAKKYICYLALAHQEKIPEIRKMIEGNGGSCLHFDGTNDGASPHLIVAIDEMEQLVLGSIKAPSESAESVGALLKQVKRDYGVPLATVHDLSKANLSAVQSVFPGVADYVCHYHFLRDIGKDLIGYEESQIRSILQGSGVKGHLKTLAKKLREFVDTDQLQALLKTASITPETIRHLAEIDIVYFLTEWILDFAQESSGYGFPFDREKLVFIQRMQEVSTLIRALPKSDGYLRILQEELEKTLEDTMLIRLVAEMEKKAGHFDRLRNGLRIAQPEGILGLNDDGKNCDMGSIKKAVEKFIESKEIKHEVLRDPVYRKMLAQIKKYWDKLFTKPITVTSKSGQTTTIQPQRTNSLMERFFREINRGCRKRTGGKTMGRVLSTMLAETPLIKNLENKKYEEIILSGKATLAERFAEIEANQAREKMKQATQTAEKLHPAVQSLIRIPNLPDCLIGTHTPEHMGYSQLACA